MFLIPLAVLPFIVGLAVYRLYSLPRAWAGGKLSLCRTPTHWQSVIAILAYASLCAYTAGLTLMTFRLLLHESRSTAAWLAMASWSAAYPFAYLDLEWIVYYAFKRPGPSD